MGQIFLNTGGTEVHGENDQEGAGESALHLPEKLSFAPPELAVISFFAHPRLAPWAEFLRRSRGCGLISFCFFCLRSFAVGFRHSLSVKLV